MEDERFLADIDKVFHYLHGGSGEFDGLVQACRKNRLGTGERFSSRYFEFRHYAGTGTMHFYPKSESVIEKLNLFVGRLRKWLPGEMEEANSDFQKQYEQGEAFTKDYLKAYAKTGPGRYNGRNPAYKLLRSLQGKDPGDETTELEALGVSIEQVHKQHNLHCGPALSGMNSAMNMLPCENTKTTDQVSARPESISQQNLMLEF